MFIHSNRFSKTFRSMSAKIQGKVIERLKILIQDEYDPRLNNHKLHGEYSNYKIINITDDIRLIYKKVESDKFFLITIGKHNQLYG